MARDPQEEEIQAYLTQIKKRILQVEKELNNIHTKEENQAEELTQTRELLKKDIETLEEDIRAIEQRLSKEVKNVLQVIELFKDSVRQPQYQRVKRRVDEWKGERLISRTEFKRVLAEAFE